MNQLHQVRFLTMVLQISQQAAQSARRSADLLPALAALQDKNGKSPCCELIPMDDIRSARVKKGPLRSRIDFDVPGRAGLSFTFVAAVQQRAGGQVGDEGQRQHERQADPQGGREDGERVVAEVVHDVVDEVQPERTSGERPEAQAAEEQLERALGQRAAGDRG